MPRLCRDPPGAILQIAPGFVQGVCGLCQDADELVTHQHASTSALHRVEHIHRSCAYAHAGEPVQLSMHNAPPLLAVLSMLLFSLGTGTLHGQHTCQYGVE